MVRKLFRISEVATIAGAARQVSRQPSAIRQAIERGKVQAVTLACGSRVVVLASVVAWDKSDSTPGRKQSKKPA